MIHFTLSEVQLSHLPIELASIQTSDAAFHYRISKRPLEAKPHVQVVVPYDSIKALQTPEEPKVIGLFHDYFKDLKICLEEQYPKELDKYTEYVCLIVIENKFIASEPLAWEIAMNNYHVLKNVVDISSLSTILKGSFPLSITEELEPPSIYITKDRTYDPPKPNNSEAHAQVYYSQTELFDSITENHTEVLKLSAQLANQLTGGLFFMNYDEQTKDIKWAAGANGYQEDYDFASIASKTLLSLCVGIAKAALSPTKPNSLTIPPVLGVLDSMRVFRLTRILKEFVNNTNIGLYITVSSSNLIDQLTRLFRSYPSMTYNDCAY
jgi:hypothetical protein